MNDVITETLALWMPSIVAIIGIIITVFRTTLRAREAFNIIKGDNYQRDLAKEQKIVNEKLAMVFEENAKLKKILAEVLDNQRRINGYTEAKYEESKNKKPED